MICLRAWMLALVGPMVPDCSSCGNGCEREYAVPYRRGTLARHYIDAHGGRSALRVPDARRGGVWALRGCSAWPTDVQHRPDGAILDPDAAEQADDEWCLGRLVAGDGGAEAEAPVRLRFVTFCDVSLHCKLSRVEVLPEPDAGSRNGGAAGEPR